MNEFLFKDREHPARMGGVQKVYRFPNGLGASVICSPFSYGGDEGLWEIGVIKFRGDTEHWGLTYDTPITDDVIGRLSWNEVEETLKQIKELPNETDCGTTD
jgi:hypothetical protein